MPLVFMAMTGLWVVECNRMVRAGYYIRNILWPEMKRITGYAGTAEFQQWIRLGKGHEASVFRERQDRLQLVAVAILPCLVSVGYLGVALWFNAPDPFWLWTTVVILAIVVIFWLWIRKYVRELSFN